MRLPSSRNESVISHFNSLKNSFGGGALTTAQQRPLARDTR
jgi:hypothetical protein